MGAASFRAELTAEQLAVLAKNGMPVASEHSSTRNRRLAKMKRPFPVISRSGRRYREPDGRWYGEVPDNDQRQADAGAWRAGEAVRVACEPMTVAVGGIVKRIYEVRSWHQQPGQTKWTAELGRELDDDTLDRDYPDYPYRREGRRAECETRNGGAYRPEYY